PLPTTGPRPSTASTSPPAAGSEPPGLSRRSAFLGLAEEESLGEVTAELADGARLAGGLEALGHDPDLDVVGVLDHAADQALLVLGAVDAPHHGHVDVDEVWFEHRDGVEAGVAGAEIVDGELVAEPGEGASRVAEPAEVRDGRALGELEHDGVLALLSGAPGRQLRVIDLARVQVDEQLASWRQLRSAGQRQLAAQPPQAPEAARLDRRLEQHRGILEQRMTRPGQGLVGPHRAGSWLDDGLVGDAELTPFDDVVELGQARGVEPPHLVVVEQHALTIEVAASEGIVDGDDDVAGPLAAEQEAVDPGHVGPAHLDEDVLGVDHEDAEGLGPEP